MRIFKRCCFKVLTDADHRAVHLVDPLGPQRVLVGRIKDQRKGHLVARIFDETTVDVDRDHFGPTLSQLLSELGAKPAKTNDSETRHDQYSSD